MRKSGITRLALKISEGLLATVTDLLLFQFFMMGSTLGKSKTSKGGYQAAREASESLDEFNYQTIKEGLRNLRRKGLIRALKEPEITSAGYKRLKSLLPAYQLKRPWDKAVYLIIYDIEEDKHYLRDKLREYLIKLGAGFLQASVWLIPYNPQQILKDFSSKNYFAGEIIVSCIGKDGYIGEESLEQLINRVYKLDDLNYQYKEFINKFSHLRVDKWQTAVAYLSILQQDPQLPWELLSDDWLGDKAYRLYQKILS